MNSFTRNSNFRLWDLSKHEKEPYSNKEEHEFENSPPLNLLKSAYVPHGSNMNSKEGKFKKALTLTSQQASGVLSSYRKDPLISQQLKVPEHSTSSTKRSFQSDLSSQNNKDPCHISKLPQNLLTEKFRILVLKNAEHEKLTPSFFLNICGLFGNAIAALKESSSNNIYVEMETHKQAINTQKTLNKKKIYNQILIIELEEFDELLEKNFTSVSSFKREMRKNFRYKVLPKIKINPPSKIIHLTSIPDRTTIAQLETLILQEAVPLDITKLNSRGKNSPMYLIKFEKIDDCLAVIGNLHNSCFDEKILKLSFSQKKANVTESKKQVMIKN